MMSNDKFLTALQDLGSHWDFDDELFAVIEEFVCCLYGRRKEEEVNKVRYFLFMTKYSKEGKCVDMSTLPPCRSTLRLKVQRCNYVAKIWKSSEIPLINPPSFTTAGWNNDGSINGITDPVPDAVADVLFDPEYDSEVDEGDDVETDEESERKMYRFF